MEYNRQEVYNLTMETLTEFTKLNEEGIRRVQEACKNEAGFDAKGIEYINALADCAINIVRQKN